MICFVNDTFVSNAQVPLLDLGVLRGYGVFEFVRTYDGQLFHLEAHLKRFFASAKTIGLQVPYSAEEIETLSYETLKQNGLADGSIKMLLTAGVSLNGFEFENRPLFALIANRLPECKKVLKVATAHYERYLPECKTLNYLPAMLERKKAQALGFDEVLFLDRHDCILEGARENFFAIKDGVLITPKDGVLQGVTRQFVISIASELMDVQERRIQYDELFDCSEAFFTSSAREIAPIKQIDKTPFACDRTQDLVNRFKEKTYAAIEGLRSL